MNFAVIDDDFVFLRDLEKHVIKICNINQVECKIRAYQDAMSFLDDKKAQACDVIFLDIDMPGINGIELAKQINDARISNTIPYIIFVSAMDNLVFDALQQFPYSFVRKSHLEDVEKCILNIAKMRKSSPVYAIKEGRTTKLIELEKTLYLEKQGNYVYFYTTDGVYQERSLIEDKYKDLEHYGFLRPHVGAIVNAMCIKEINSNYLRLTNGKEISISRNYKNEIKKKHFEWIARL